MCQPFRPSAGAAALCRKILLRRGTRSARADVLIIISAPLVPESLCRPTRRAVRASGRFQLSSVRRQCRSRFAGRRGAPSARADVLIILSAPLVPASSRRPRRAVCFTSCFPLFLPSRLKLLYSYCIRCRYFICI